MELSLLIIFWYGILHAFGPDHLTAITDFSIGKNKRKTMMITVLFALGHGTMLFVFAKILEHYAISESLLAYGDIISSSVILMMGVYLLYMVWSDRIQLRKHTHEGKEHIHIYFGKEHDHKSSDKASAFTIGALMGIGGVRGMLITFGAIQGQTVDFSLVLAFTAGVMLVFLCFGVILSYINENLLTSKKSVRKIFSAVGVISVLVGGNMLFADEPIHGHPTGTHTEMHQAGEYPVHDDANALVASKKKSDMSYAQMMQQLEKGMELMQSGVINENTALVRLGATLINDHPAPREKPWSIVKDEDREAFKETLLAYDVLLHESVTAVTEELPSKDWAEINQKVFEVTNHCISCHSMWKENVNNQQEG